MFKTAAVTVGTTPTEPTVIGEDVADYVAGSSLAVRFDGTPTIYVGGADVTTGNGFPLVSGDSYDLDQGERLYAVVSSGTQSVRVIRRGVQAP